MHKKIQNPTRNQGKDRVVPINRQILSFTNGWFCVMAGDIVELDAIIVEIVEDSQAEFITLAVIWLGNSTSKNTVINYSGLIFKSEINLIFTLQCVRRVL